MKKKKKRKKITTFFHFSPRTIRAKKIDFCLVGIYDNEGLGRGESLHLHLPSIHMDCIYLDLFFCFWYFHISSCIVTFEDLSHVPSCHDVNVREIIFSPNAQYHQKMSNLKHCTKHTLSLLPWSHCQIVKWIPCW